MIGQLELDSHDIPVFRSKQSLATTTLKKMFRESRAYGLCDEHGTRVKKALPVVSTPTLERLLELIQRKKLDKNRQKAAAAIFIALYCGVPYHNIPDISLSGELGVIKYKNQTFLPCTRIGMQKLWLYGVQHKVCDANNQPPLEDLLKIFSLPVDLYDTFSHALSLLKTGLPEPQRILNVLRSLGLPRSIFFPQLVFLGRLEKLKASNELKSLFMLPWSRIPPYDKGLVVIRHFDDEVGFNFKKKNTTPRDFGISLDH